MQGCGPTVVRAMVVNAAQLATYSQAKQFLLTTCKTINTVHVYSFELFMQLILSMTLNATSEQV